MAIKVRLKPRFPARVTGNNGITVTKTGGVYDISADFSSSVPTVAGINIGATDTTVTRASAGDIAVEGNQVYRAGGTDVPVTDGGTGASTVAAARTAFGLGTADTPTFAGVSLAMGADSATAVTVKGANGNNRLTIGADGSGNAVIATANNVTLGLGVTTADDVVVTTTDVQTTLPIIQELGADNLIAYTFRGASGNDRGAFGVTSGGVPYFRSKNGAALNLGINTTDSVSLESNGLLGIGATGSILGQVKLYGSTSGAVSIKPQATAGTFDLILPAAAPSTGQVWWGHASTPSFAPGPIRVILRATGVDFNTSADTTIPVALPPGFTRYLVGSCRISGASASLTTATCGLFTAASGGGTAIVTGGASITVSTASEDTNNNAQVLTINNANTNSYTAANLYFLIGTPQGSAATATVTVELILL